MPTALEKYIYLLKWFLNAVLPSIESCLYSPVISFSHLIICISQVWRGCGDFNSHLAYRYVKSQCCTPPKLACFFILPGYIVSRMEHLRATVCF